MSARQSSGGNWYYRFKYNKHDYCQGGFRIKTQAIEAERLKRNSLIDCALHPQRKEMTFREAADWWLRFVSPFKRSGFVDKARLPLMVECWGEKQLGQLTPEDIEQFLGSLSKLRSRTVKDHTRNHYLALIKALYNKLIERQLFKGFNPALSIDRIKVPTVRVRFLYPEEEKRLTIEIAKDRILWPYYYLGLQTGMRIGEMRSVLVRQIDERMKYIFLENSKNFESRYVPLEDEDLRFLANYANGKLPTARLLPACSYSHLRKHFKLLLTRLEIPNVDGWHVLRHTFAYHHLARGTPLYVVSKLLGHSSEAVTQKHYGHLAPNDLVQASKANVSFLRRNRIAIDLPNFGLPMA